MTGCNRRPKGILSDNEMVTLLTDLLIADAFEQSSAISSLPDSVSSRLSENVLKEHGVDRATLDSTYAWYSRNIDEYYDLYAKVDRKLIAKRKKLGKFDENSADNDIWPYSKHLLFSPISSRSDLIFDIPPEMLSKGETLEWRMKLLAAGDADILLGIDYEDGSTSFTNKKFSDDRKIILKIIADSAKTISRIFGTAKINRLDMPLWADSIALIKEPFDSISYSSFRYQRFTPGTVRRQQKTTTVQSDSLERNALNNNNFSSSEILNHNQNNHDRTQQKEKYKLSTSSAPGMVNSQNSSKVKTRIRK